jgi:signal transduction histidine kinase
MSGERILVVDDEPNIVDLVTMYLEREGYRVESAYDGAQALEQIQVHEPALVVLDLMLPEVDGFEVCRQTRVKSDVPIIMLTARDDDVDKIVGLELGADDYLTKPFDEEDLLVAVRAKLARWEQLRRQRSEQIADLKRTILTTLSHEFRTPLTYVITYAELLGQDQEQIAPEDFRQFMQGIRKGADRLNRLVEDFITLVELETGEGESVYLFRRQWLKDTSAWLRRIGEQHRPAAEAQGLALIMQVPEDLPPLLADEIYLSDAIGRLLENAIKFSKPTSEWVRFTAEANDTWLRIAIQDQGIGIREEARASLFNVFHQIDRAKQEQQGTGSGLAICKGVVELHGGRVIVESEYGVGSTFTVEVPFSRPDR